jgi:hypothetical protein
VQGYSSLAVALVLPEGGLLVACDRDERALAVARGYYRRAGVLHKVFGLILFFCRSIMFQHGGLEMGYLASPDDSLWWIGTRLISGMA